MARSRSPQGRATERPQLRITFYPAGPAPLKRASWLDSAPWVLGLAAAVLLMFATVGWSWWSGAMGHALADFYYWKGREASRAGEAKVVTQRWWQQSVAADPHFNRARLDLARSYIDALWYHGAIAQSEAVIAQRHSRWEAVLAYTYMGYGHYMLGDEARGLDELETATQLDPGNAIAQSVLERLQLRGKLSKSDVEETFRTLEGMAAPPADVKR